MIGQVKLLKKVERLIEEGEFPRFSIFVGERGSGRKTIIELIGSLMGAIRVYNDDVSVGTIRTISEHAYRITEPTIYRIADADSMLQEAQNALLKVTEESPNSAYFIMTLEDENNVFETIRSRATIFHMDRYTPDEIESYLYPKLRDKKDFTKAEIEICRNICNTPGDAELICNNDIQPFYDFVVKVVENISDVSVANAFRISQRIAFKGEPEKYDLKLFWKVFQHICFENWMAEKMQITSRYLQKLKIRSINKQMLFDSWLFELRC